MSGDDRAVGAVIVADLFLVRHGQASFGAAVYDKLSPLGEHQSILLGKWLRRCGVVPDSVAVGHAERQIDTAKLSISEAGGVRQGQWASIEGLNEYDHESIVSIDRPEYADRERLQAHLAKSDHPRRAFQEIYVKAVARWTGGAHDADYPESWRDFRSRVIAGLTRLVALDAKSVWAFTSGGPITAILQHLLGLSDERAFDLNWPLVNTGITRLRFAKGHSPTLATYNAHPHLDEAGNPDLITYR